MTRPRQSLFQHQSDSSLTNRGLSSVNGNRPVRQRLPWLAVAAVPLLSLLMQVTPTQATGGGWWPEQKAPTTVVSVNQPADRAERILLEGLVGLWARAVNEERGDSLVWVDRSAHYRNWKAETLHRLGVSERRQRDVWRLLQETIQKGYLDGFVVYQLGPAGASEQDPLDHSLNIATMLAGVLNAAIIEESLIDEALARGLTQLADARTLEYEEAWNQYADQFDRSRLFVISPANDARVERMRDLAVAHRARVAYGVTDVTAAAMQNTPIPNPVFGWNSGDEFSHISQASRLGLFNTVSVWLSNVTVLSAGARDYEMNRIPALNPVTINWSDQRMPVSFVMSDGDNTGWVGRDFWGNDGGTAPGDYWDHPEHGDFPIGFTVATSDLADFAPVVIDRLATTKPEHTTVIHFSAYYYPDLFAINRSGRETALRELARVKAREMKKTGSVTMTFISQNSSSPAALEAMQIFAEEINPLLGMLIMDYSPYNAKQGQVFWFNDGKGGQVPAVTARYAMWQGLNHPNSGSPEAVAGFMNQDQGKFAGAWGVVHAWSQFPRPGGSGLDRGVPAVRRAVDAIDTTRIHVTSPEEMLWRKRVAHNRNDAERLNEQISGLPPGSGPRLGQIQTLFNSGFNPENEVDFAPRNRPVGWGGDNNSTYPVRRWSYAPERAPVESNGYFGEVVRYPGSNEQAWEMSTRFVVPHKQEYQIAFDFKANTDPSINAGKTDGKVVFKFRQHDPFQGDIWLNLYDGATQTTIGDHNWKEGNFDTIRVTEPDANGWRTVTVTGTTTGAGENADLWFEGWTLSNPTHPHHFTGSFGIDNVVMKDGIETLPGIQSWRLTHFGTSENIGDAANFADPDGDGLNNLLEYALGTDPTVPNDGSPLAAEIQNGYLSLTFSHIGDPTLIFSIEAASQLDGEWTVVHTYPTFTEPGIKTYTGGILTTEAPKQFLRLIVTEAAGQ